jgi:hypothetical protein
MVESNSDSGSPPASAVGKWLIIAALLLVGLAAGLAGLWIWQQLGPVSLSVHGWLAIAAGVVGSLLLGGGLMWLSFFSARSGHDERVRDHDPLA